jgi:hypothetical protein
VWLALAVQFAIAAGGLAGAVALQRIAADAAMDWWTGLPDWVILGLSLLGTGFVTGLVGAYGFALYLVTANRGEVADWQFSAQAIEDGKGFLRLHVGNDGRLTVYPVVVDEVCRDWNLASGGEGGVLRPVPARPVRPRLLEPPVVVERAAAVAGLGPVGSPMTGEPG